MSLMRRSAGRVTASAMSSASQSNRRPATIAITMVQTWFTTNHDLAGAERCRVMTVTARPTAASWMIATVMASAGIEVS